MALKRFSDADWKHRNIRQVQGGGGETKLETRSSSQKGNWWGKPEIFLDCERKLRAIRRLDTDVGESLPLYDISPIAAELLPWLHKQLATRSFRFCFFFLPWTPFFPFRVSKEFWSSRDRSSGHSLRRLGTMMRMFMALILNFIRPFNTHDHYANERIMRLQTEGAFQTLQRWLGILANQKAVPFFASFDYYLTLHVFLVYSFSLCLNIQRWFSFAF